MVLSSIAIFSQNSNNLRMRYLVSIINFLVYDFRKIWMFEVILYILRYFVAFIYSSPITFGYVLHLVLCH